MNSIRPIKDNGKINNIQLEKWLQKKCELSDNIFEDPGYSDYYRDRYRIYDLNRNYYKINDIDEKLNIGYVHVDQESDDDLLDAEKYVDFVPSDKNSANSKYTGIAILPGSNHSNANYIFKLINEYTQNTPYKIPTISSDPATKFEGTCTNIRMDIDKKNLYEFVHTYSKK